MEKKTTEPKQKAVVTESKLTLAERLLKIQVEAKTVLRTGNNRYSNYTYGTEGDYQGELKPLLDKHKLVIVSHGVTDVREVGSTVVLQMTWHLEAADTGEKGEPFTFVGAGRDTEAKNADIGDKAYPKAMTMANKYMLAKVFQLESDDDADRDDTKQPKGAAGKKSDKEDKTTEGNGTYAIALNMVQSSRNIDSLITFREGVDGSKKYTAEQKEALKKAADSRLDELTQG